MALRNWSYMGKGAVYAQSRSNPAGFLPIGNVSALSFQAEENKVTQPDYTQAGGGNANSVTRISDMTGSMTMLDFSPENLAKAWRGGITAVTGGVTVSGEQHNAWIGGLVPFDFTPDFSDYANTLTVTIDPGGTPSTAVEGTDYEVTVAGIRILDTYTGVDGAAIEVAYTKTQSYVIEAMVNAGLEFSMVFDGLNEAQEGKAFTVTVHRLKFSPAQGANLIGDEFGELPVEFEVLSDPSISGTGISKFFKAQVAD